MTDENFHMNYIKKLIVALSASGVINILLISLLFYIYLKDSPTSSYEHKPALKQEEQAVPLALSSGNAEMIHYFRSLDFDQLTEHLSNDQFVENGYTRRDLALACLVAFHQFDLNRALLGHVFPDQQRVFSYGLLKSGKPATVILYAGLTDQQFQSIIDFAESERWPLTSKGLYWKLKQSPDVQEASLDDAFYMTPDFLAVELLLNRADSPVKREEVKQLLLEGNWTMLQTFVAQQKHLQDLSPAKRQRFLLDYLNLKSQAAAYLLLKLDNEFALKKLNDSQVVSLLNLLSDKTPESERYALDLLKSPRSDSVWKLAASNLYRYADESIPEKNLHHIAMKRFVPGYNLHEEKPKAPLVVIQKQVEKPKPVPKVSVPNKIVTAPKPKPAATPVRSVKQEITNKNIATNNKPKDRLYLVQDGDTLWKVSKLFNVDMERLRSYNRLQSDALKPGTPLRIPG